MLYGLSSTRVSIKTCVWVWDIITYFNTHADTRFIFSHIALQTSMVPHVYPWTILRVFPLTLPAGYHSICVWVWNIITYFTTHADTRLVFSHIALQTSMVPHVYPWTILRVFPLTLPAGYHNLVLFQCPYPILKTIPAQPYGVYAKPDPVPTAGRPIPYMGDHWTRKE